MPGRYARPPTPPSPAGDDRGPGTPHASRALVRPSGRSPAPAGGSGRRRQSPTEPSTAFTQTFLLSAPYLYTPMNAEDGSLSSLNGPTPAWPTYWMSSPASSSSTQSANVVHSSPPSAPDTAAMLAWMVAPSVPPPLVAARAARMVASYDSGP